MMWFIPLTVRIQNAGPHSNLLTFADAGSLCYNDSNEVTGNKERYKWLPFLADILIFAKFDPVCLQVLIPGL